MPRKLPPWLVVALQELDLEVTEVPGPEHHPRILCYHQATSLKATEDEVPWCSSFVNWCMQNCGLGYKGTGSALAASWRSWGKAIEYGRLGCVVVMKRTGGNHVGFYLDEDAEGVYVLGGNQSDKVCVRRFPWNVITDFRWPRSYKDEEV